jgi:hypothetical protein
VLLTDQGELRSTPTLDEPIPAGTVQPIRVDRERSTVRRQNRTHVRVLGIQGLGRRHRTHGCDAKGRHQADGCWFVPGHCPSSPAHGKQTPSFANGQVRLQIGRPASATNN